MTEESKDNEDITLSKYTRVSNVEFQEIYTYLTSVEPQMVTNGSGKRRPAHGLIAKAIAKFNRKKGTIRRLWEVAETRRLNQLEVEDEQNTNELVACEIDVTERTNQEEVAEKPKTNQISNQEEVAGEHKTNELIESDLDVTESKKR